MKSIYSIFFVVFLHMNLFSQNNQIFGDTIQIEVKENDTIKIQWQCSFDSINWENIIGENNNILNYIINDDMFFRAKLSTENCVWNSTTKTIKFDNSKKIYGVRIDRKKPAENRIERILNSKSKESFSQIEGQEIFVKDDFKGTYPFNSMRVCNVIKNGTLSKIIYENESDFNRKQDTFVEIPLFYMKRYFESDFDYRLISQTQYEGFYPAPMFIEGGKIIDKVYVGVYETTIDDGGIARSVSGKIPANYKTMTEFRDLYYAKGAGFSTVDFRTLMSIQHLFLIRYANKNSSESVGGGWAGLIQPIKTILNTGVTNKIVLKNSSDLTNSYWFIGQNVCTVNGYQIKEYAELVSIQPNIPVQGQTTFVVNKDLNIDGTVTFGSAPQNTGWSDILTHDTGRTKNNTTSKVNEACSVKLFGIENLWGNVWEFVDGLFFKGLTPYISFNSLRYNYYKEYTPTSFQCIEQNSLLPVGGTFGFIENLGINDTYSWLCFPDSYGKNGVNGSSGYGDFYYQLNDLTYIRCTAYGGGFDHFDRAGIFNFRNWEYTNWRWYLYGSRMQYKQIN